MLSSKFFRKALLPVFAAVIAVVAGRGTISRADATPDLPDRGPAPEIRNLVWLNTDKPLHLADLRGQVVILDFWTVDCINCYHTLPYLRDMYTRLNGKGVQLIGIHYPEFNYQHDLQVVKDYMKAQAITYPVAIDNDAETWNAYHIAWWPAFELIDKNGHLRSLQVGEGHDASSRSGDPGASGRRLHTRHADCNGSRDLRAHSRRNTRTVSYPGRLARRHLLNP